MNRLTIKLLVGMIASASIISSGTLSAYADIVEEEPSPTYLKIKDALLSKDLNKIADATRYPLQICYNNQITVFPDAESLKKADPNILLGGDKTLDKVKTFFDNPNYQSGGEWAEFAPRTNYGARVIFTMSETDDENNLYILYTDEEGIINLTNSGCESKLPKLNFCNNPEYDALINMYVQLHTSATNSEYENFKDYNYSAIDGKFEDEKKMIFKGKTVNLKLDKTSLYQAPIYTDNDNQYMFLSPRILTDLGCRECEIESWESPYIHMFRKPKDSETCVDLDVVFADKYNLNFCPFNQDFNAEIRLYTEGYDNNSMMGIAFADPDKKISLKIEKAPEDSDDYIHATLEMDGKTYKTAVDYWGKLSFKTEEGEILIALEGDLDSDPEAYNNCTKIGGGCKHDNSTAVLFVRDEGGICKRVKLARK